MSETLSGAQPYDSGSYAKIVTRDASPAAGADAACVPNMRRAWQVRMGLVQAFRERLTWLNCMRAFVLSCLGEHCSVCPFLGSCISPVLHLCTQLFGVRCCLMHTRCC